MREPGSEASLQVSLVPRFLCESLGARLVSRLGVGPWCSSQISQSWLNSFFTVFMRETMSVPFDSNIISFKISFK